MASSNLDSPDHSSPESLEVEDDSPHRASSAQWPVPGQASPDGTSTSPSQPARSAPPMQKRRRVTRACDECRRKKIKCDGKQPCTHCTVYSYGQSGSLLQRVSCLTRLQSVLMINRPIEGGIQRLNTSKRLKLDFTKQKRY